TGDCGGDCGVGEGVVATAVCTRGAFSFHLHHIPTPIESRMQSASTTSKPSRRRSMDVKRDIKRDAERMRMSSSSTVEALYLSASADGAVEAPYISVSAATPFPDGSQSARALIRSRAVWNRSAASLRSARNATAFNPGSSCGQRSESGRGG